MYITKKKKEDIWLSPLAKAPTPTEKSKKQLDNIKNATKNFDYTTTADGQLSNSSHRTGVDKSVYVRTTNPKPFHKFKIHSIANINFFSIRNDQNRQAKGLWRNFILLWHIYSSNK